MSYIVVNQKGPPCPSCGRPTQVRRHDRIGEKQLRQPFYYVQWFYCTHDDCETTTYHTGDQFKVWKRAASKGQTLSSALRCKYCGALKAHRRRQRERLS